MYRASDFNTFDYRVVCISVIYILLLFLAPDNKFLFLFSFLHLLSLIIILKNVGLSMIYVYFPWFVFSQGRTFELILVPLEHIQSVIYQSPVVASFDISPFLFLIILMFLYLFFIPFDLRKYRFDKYSFLFIVLIMYILLRFISAIHTEYSILFSFVYIFEEISIFFWIILVLNFYRGNKQSIRKIFGTLLFILILLLGTEIIVSVSQLAIGGYFGLHSEKAHYVAQFGLGADESESLLRVSGFKLHPNWLAAWLVQVVSACYLLLLLIKSKKNDTKIFAEIMFLIALFVIMSVTLNRISFLTFSYAMIIFRVEVFIALKRSWHLIANFVATKTGKMLAIITILVVFFAFFRVGYRTYLSIYSFEQYGGLSTRLLQYQESLEILQKYPIFGTGPDMFQAAVFQWIPMGEIRYFPEKVHNGFLLIATESGLISLFLIFTLYCYLILYAVHSEYKKIAVIIIFHTFLNMMLHSVDTHFLTVSGAVLILAVLYEKKYLQSL